METVRAYFDEHQRVGTRALDGIEVGVQNLFWTSAAQDKSWTPSTSKMPLEHPTFG
ncbi:MAG: hypothetical protein ABFS56_13670 [Pseudomonadota bacterium]